MNLIIAFDRQGLDLECERGLKTTKCAHMPFIFDAGLSFVKLVFPKPFFMQASKHILFHLKASNTCVLQVVTFHFACSMTLRPSIFMTINSQLFGKEFQASTIASLAPNIF
jgi:hypothetical protein